MLSINTNTNALFALSNLQKTNRSLSKISQQFATGKRVNSAADDPAGSSIISKMTSRINGLKVAKDNVADAKSLIKIADGGLQGIEKKLQDMRELATAARSDTNSADERTAIQSRFDELVAEIDDYVSQSTFNGIALIDGSANLTIQSGANVGDTTNITIGQDFTAEGLSVHELTLDSGANAEAAITAIDTALTNVNQGMSSLGALTNRFENRMNFIDVAIENNSAARSRIQDVDMAELAAENVSMQMKQQTNLFAVGQAIQLPQSIMSLLM